MENQDLRRVGEVLTVVETQAVPDICSPILESGELVGYCWIWNGASRREYTSIKAFAPQERISIADGAVTLTIPQKNIELRRGDQVIHLEGDDECELTFDLPTGKPPSAIGNLVNTLLEAVDVAFSIR